jgi:hypothetical protein
LKHTGVVPAKAPARPQPEPWRNAAVLAQEDLQEASMKVRTMLAGTAVVALGWWAGVVFGQVQPQTVEIVRVDVVKVQSGFRASKVIGASVVNASNDTIGKVDDVIISADGKAPYAILSVGGFLGIGNRLIAVPYDALRFDDKVSLPGATKESLKVLPEFRYAN